MTRTSTLFRTRALVALAALAFTLAQSGGFTSQATAAELAKEGTFSIRAAWSGAWQGFAMGVAVGGLDGPAPSISRAW